MNNKQLNREFTQSMKDRNRFTKTGFTDSEEDEDDDETTNKSMKSPKSGRSSVSERSSLLSARSPRREESYLTAQKRPVLGTIKRPEARKVSPGSDEDTLSTPGRRSNRFSQEPKLSPKSPRSSDRSEPSFPRFNQRTMRPQDNFNNNDDDRITPRSSRSASDKDDFNNINMLTTMKKPLNDSLALNKTMKRTDVFDASKTQKIRAATPTKLTFAQKSPSSNQVAPQRRIQMQPKFEDDIFEEDGHLSGKTSARSTPTHSSQRPSSYRSQSPPHKSSPPHRSPSIGRSMSPHDSLSVTNEDDIDKDKMVYMNHAKNVDILMNPNTDALIQQKTITIEPKQKTFEEDTNSFYENPDKDPQVTETIEDSRASQKLRQQREAKRIQREQRAQTQTESTRKLEEAIETVENVMEDSIRYNTLKEKSKELKYSTKPLLNETRSRPNRSVSVRQSRTRSSSESSRFERRLGDKYSHVKPKTQTRLPVQSARNENDFMNSSKTSLKYDALNDSSSIRQNIYNEWYQKKMASAQEQLKEAQSRQRNDEELKAQELINKLEKSQLEYNKWCESKEGFIQNKKDNIEAAKKAKKDEKAKRDEQKKIAVKAFEEWLRIKQERLKEEKEETKDKQIKTEKQTRKLKEKTVEKPPLPFEAWAKKKENQIQEKLSTEKQKERDKKQKEKDKEERKKLAQVSYYEWLDKKEQLDDKKELSRSLSSSMSALPPFYPSSKTIPFGR